MLATTSFSYNIPTRIVFGVGSVGRVGDEVKRLGKAGAFVVTDAGAVKAGLLQPVQESLHKAGITVEVFDQVQADPSGGIIEEGVRRFAADPGRAIIGLGGGSSMDSAKAIGARATNPGHILDYRRGGKRIMNATPPIIAIPTTAGTGSEVTPVAMVTDTESHTKVAIISGQLYVRLALLDPALTRTLPPSVTAATGMDAMTHAVEAYTSSGANPITDALAIGAIKMIGANLREAVANGDNIEARSQMLMASNMAALAFGTAGTGLAHAMAHPLGACFHIPHGVACAVVLRGVMLFNLASNPRKFADIAVALGERVDGLEEMAAAERAVAAIATLNTDVGIPADLRQYGATREAIEAMAKDAHEDPVNTPFNPRTAQRQDIIAIFQSTIPG